MLKAYLTYYNEVTKKSPEKILILQNKTEAKSNASYHNTNSAETKDSFSSLDTSFMSNRQSLKDTSVNITGAVLGRGAIFGALSL